MIRVNKYLHYFTTDVLMLIKLVYTGKRLLKLDTLPSSRCGHQQHALLIHCQGDRLQEQQRLSTKGYFFDVLPSSQK